MGRSVRRDISVGGAGGRKLQVGEHPGFPFRLPPLFLLRLLGRLGQSAHRDGRGRKLGPAGPTCGRLEVRASRRGERGAGLLGSLIAQAGLASTLHVPLGPFERLSAAVLEHAASNLAAGAASE